VLSGRHVEVWDENSKVRCYATPSFYVVIHHLGRSASKMLEVPMELSSTANDSTQRGSRVRRTDSTQII
jgi:hypothetical protein